MVLERPPSIVTMALEPSLDALLEEEARQRQQGILERLGLAYATSYSTLAPDQVSFLAGRQPTAGDPAEAARWRWEPVTQTFVNHETRDYMTRSEYLAAFYPDVLAERTLCRRVPVEPVRLGPGLPAAADEALADKPPDVAALAAYVFDADGNLVGSDAVLVDRDATRAQVISALAERGALPPDANVDAYRVILPHPRLFDFEAAAPLPGLSPRDLYEDTSIGDALKDFGGLGADDAQRLSFVVPVMVEPARRQARRLARAAVRPVVLSRAGDVRERIGALVRETASRRAALADLARRAGRTLDERAAEEEAAIEERRHALSQRRPRQPRSEASPEAEIELEAALGALFASVAGDRPLPPGDEAAVIEWLVSAVLSGKVTEGVDYAAAYDALRQRLLAEAFAQAGGSAEAAAATGGPGPRAVVAFLQQIDALVDDARDIERRAATSRERVPVFDPATGDVVGFEERLPAADEADPGDVPIAIVRGVPVLPPDAIARAEGVIDVARAQCHTCRRWRAVRPEAMAQRIDYAIRYDAAASAEDLLPTGGAEMPPPLAPAQADCVRFGFEFQHTLPTGLPPTPEGRANVERVPIDSQYVVVRAPAPGDLAAAAPDAMRPLGATTIEGFAVAGRTTDDGGRDLYDVEFGLLPGRSFLVPAAAVGLYAIPPRDSISRATGLVTVVATTGDEDEEEEEEEQRAYMGTAYRGGYAAPERRVVPGGRALNYFCELAGGAGVLRVPVTGLRGYEARQWECGDPTMDPHSSPVRELLARLAREEAFERAMGPALPEAARSEVRARIARLRDALHSEPEETAEEIEARLGAVGVSESSAADRAWDEMAADLDTVARNRIDAVRDFIEAEAEGVSEEAAALEEQQQQRREEARGRTRPRSPEAARETSREREFKRARLDQEERLADQADALVDRLIGVRRLARAARALGRPAAAYDTQADDLSAQLDAIERESSPDTIEALGALVPSAEAVAEAAAPAPRGPTFYERGLATLADAPQGLFTRDAAVATWLAGGGAPAETVGLGSQAFRTFLKRLNAALKRPRVGAPVLYVPYGPLDAPDRYGGLYILREFVRPDTVDAIVSGAVDDAARRGRELDPALIAQRLVGEATALP
nr:Neuromodulin N incomplete domain containing protein [Pandoravirus belohorizontensis]